MRFANILKYHCCLAVFIVYFLSSSNLHAADYSKIYKIYYDQGIEAYRQNNLYDALKYFKEAHAVSPDEEAPVRYINLIKRLQESKVRSTEIVAPPVRIVPSPPKITSKPSSTTPTSNQARIPSQQVTLIQDAKEFQQQEIVYLDQNLWQTQPGTLLRIDLNSYIVLEGINIDRNLIITPGIVEVERIDKDHVRVLAKQRGITFLHLWDDTGRWTFNIEVILPLRKLDIKQEVREAESYAQPFKFIYTGDWSTFYQGPSYSELDKRSVQFLQRMVMQGETPYGDFDGFAVVNRSNDITELSGYGVGLTDGSVGPFEDFTFRLFDIRKTFSPLTLPGRFMRGVLFESKAFDKNIEYTYVRGRDRRIFGFISPDAFNERDSYVEGLRVVLFPEEDNQYAFNFARGFGDDRQSFLKDRVFSVEAQRRIGGVLASTEVAYDEESFAHTARTRYKGDNYTLGFNFRNISEDFTTITNSPGGRGELGGSIFYNWQTHNINLRTNLDLYRQRFLANPNDKDALNIDFNSTLEMPFSTKSRLLTSIYYTDTSGELSPRNNLRVQSDYHKRLRFLNRDVSFLFGGGYQRSRFDFSAPSEFDRYSLTAGFNVGLIKYVNYYANYEYSLVDEILSEQRLTPSVFNTGVNFSKSLSKSWSMRSSFSYRDETKTDGTNSFLAGEDNITSSLGFNYRPFEDFEFYIDGRTRNVWAEANDRDAFNEIDVRTGVRIGWDLPFRWNPTGVVYGYVYKDLNGNKVRDIDEEGIADVVVKVGKGSVTTDNVGYYESTIKAKSADVTLDLNSLPPGFIFSTNVLEVVDIRHGGAHQVNFGLNTRSGIYGVVFADKNVNGKPDPGEEVLRRVRIVLDNNKFAFTDFEGTYFFENVSPGKHEIQIDVNSIPINYLPQVKVKNSLEVSEGATYTFHVPLKQK